MIALCGFGDEFPISVYYYEREKDFEINEFNELMKEIMNREKHMQF
jgi:hypothetical protein